MVHIKNKILIKKSTLYPEVYKKQSNLKMLEFSFPLFKKRLFLNTFFFKKYVIDLMKV